MLQDKLSRFSLALLLSLAVTPAALAQSGPPQPDKVVEPGAEPVGSGGRSAGTHTRAVTVVVGWNNIHAFSCLLTRKGTVYTMKLNAHDDEGVYLTTTLIPYQTTMAAQCATGNWISFYVTKKTGNTFTWSNLQAWSYQ